MRGGQGDSVRAVTAVPPSFVTDVDRVVMRLRTMPTGRLRGPLAGPFATRAGAGRALASALAVATQGIDDADQPEPPLWRRLPELPDLSVGDQVRVLAHDFVGALATAGPEAWTVDGRRPTADVVEGVMAALVDVAAVL
jgi:hypothetical protein